MNWFSCLSIFLLVFALLLYVYKIIFGSIFLLNTIYDKNPFYFIHSIYFGFWNETKNFTTVSFTCSSRRSFMNINFYWIIYLFLLAQKTFCILACLLIIIISRRMRNISERAAFLFDIEYLCLSQRSTFMKIETCTKVFLVLTVSNIRYLLNILCVNAEEIFYVS